MTLVETYPSLSKQYGKAASAAGLLSARPICTSIPKKRLELLTGLEKFLKTLSGQTVLFYPTPGNGGDSLIHAGTYQAFDRAGVDYRPINLDDDVRGHTVIIGGGANLTPLYRELRFALLEGEILDRCRNLIILPHTIRGNEDLLLQMDDRVTIFCRDPESYLHVQYSAKTKNIYLEHDMALHLDIQQFYAECEKYPDVFELFDHLVGETRFKFLTDDSSTVRNFFRTDGETIFEDEKAENLDISILFSLGTWPENAQKASWCFLEAVKRSGKVLTDRLHVGIAATLLNKKCSFYDNSYGKNRTVFLHSVRRYADPQTIEFVLER